MPVLRPLDLVDPPHGKHLLIHTPMNSRVMIEAERYARLFRNGRNQALRIPRECELAGDEVLMRKDGDRLIIEPVRKGRLPRLLD